MAFLTLVYHLYLHAVALYNTVQLIAQCMECLMLSAPLCLIWAYLVYRERRVKPNQPIVSTSGQFKPLYFDDMQEGNAFCLKEAIGPFSCRIPDVFDQLTYVTYINPDVPYLYKARFEPCYSE